MLRQSARAFDFQGEGWHRHCAAGQMRLQQKARLVPGKPHHIVMVAGDSVFLRLAALGADLVQVIGMGRIRMGDGRIFGINLLARGRLALIGAVFSTGAAHPTLPWPENRRRARPFLELSVLGELA
jgi:hypothetical protein